MTTRGRCQGPYHRVKGFCGGPLIKDKLTSCHNEGNDNGYR